MYTIKVIDTRDGRPVEYTKVGVVYHGFFPGSTKDLSTDSNGEAHFDYDNGNGEVYVNGKKPYDGEIKGRIVIYI